MPPDALILAQNAPKCVELERSPRPPSRKKGGLLLRGGGGKGGRKGRERRGGKLVGPPNNFYVAPPMTAQSLGYCTTMYKPTRQWSVYQFSLFDVAL